MFTYVQKQTITSYVYIVKSDIQNQSKPKFYITHRSNTNLTPACVYLVLWTESHLEKKPKPTKQAILQLSVR